MKKYTMILTAIICLFLTMCSFPASGEGQPMLTLSHTELTLDKGKSQQIKYTLENVENPKKAKLTWASSDPDVAQVSSGNVKAKEGGTAVITCSATLADGSVISASLDVTVTVPVRGLKILTKSNTMIPYGQALQLEYEIQPENATDKSMTWKSSNEEILRVDGKGIVTAVSAGKASITGTTANGKNAKVTLTVPMLSPSSEVFRLTATDSVYHFTYCGKDFDKNVQLKVKGNCFEYSLIRNDPDIGVKLIPLAPGEGTLTVTDKKDSSAKFTVTITVSDDAFPAGRRLLIKDAAYDPAEGKLTVDWTNTGSKAVTEAEIRINPLNADGSPLVIGDGKMEEILEERRIFHTSALVEPGKTITSVFVLGEDYPTMTQAEIAFDRIVAAVYAEDGSITEREITHLPDDRLCWYSTAQNAYTLGPQNGDPYFAPGDDVMATASEIKLGFTAYPVTTELAEAYGYNSGGLLIVMLEEGSPADAMGLEAGDLITEINDMRYAQEPYFIALGIADLIQGKPFALLFERDHVNYELTLEPEE